MCCTFHESKIILSEVCQFFLKIYILYKNMISITQSLENRRPLVHYGGKVPRKVSEINRVDLAMPAVRVLSYPCNWLACESASRRDATASVAVDIHHPKDANARARERRNTPMLPGDSKTCEGQEEEITADMRPSRAPRLCRNRYLIPCCGSLPAREDHRRGDQRRDPDTVPTLGTTLGRVTNLAPIRLPDAARKVNTAAGAKGQRGAKRQRPAVVVNK